MTTSPTVTVLIPTYNRADLLPGAMDSVLAQTFADFELLVIDDGSTDSTADLLRRYADPRLRLVRNSRNLGSPRTRNLGLDLARGRYVAMLDSDDVALPHRLERQVAFLESHPDHALVGSNKRPLSGRPKLGQLLRARPLAAPLVRARMLFRCAIAHSTVMARTEILKRHRYREDFPVTQDYELFVRLADLHPLANLREALVRVRRHAGQVSRQRVLVEDRQKAILALQLETLGVDWTPDDLHRHFLLARPRSWKKPEAADLEWAETWLGALAAANRRSKRYPGDVLEQVLGEVWLELVIKALPAAAASFSRWLWRSPLAASAWRSLRQRAPA